MIVKRLMLSVVLAGVIGGSASAQTTIHVSPAGDDAGTGRADRPFRTLERAQAETRRLNDADDVIVELDGGVYRLAAPLRFGSEDGGQGSRTVVWRSEPGERATLSGGVIVTGWRLHDAERRIFVADVPPGLNTRQLYIDGAPIPRAAMHLDASEVTYDAEGLRLAGDAARAVAGLADPSRLEFHALGLWSHRIAPVVAVEGDRLRLAQPAWFNSYSNNDTASGTRERSLYRLSLENAYEFLTLSTWLGNSDRWHLDPDEGKLYVRAGYALDLTQAEVILPALESLVSVSGEPGRPVENLSFEGLRFSHTTWNAPSGPDGYAAVQTGAFLRGMPEGVDIPAFGDCPEGCEAFERQRDNWFLIPAAVQVSNARNLAFRRNVFSQLGQVGLGIGMDGDANLSGVDLGAQDIVVERNRFAALGGGAIIAGGVRPDAHHPSRPELLNRNLRISDNVITDIARDYKDNAAIFVPYFQGLTIEHNDISDTPYSPIAVGWGWGHNDVGGTYGLAAERGRYRFQPRHETPTIMRDVLIANNRLTNVNRDFLDGGGIYTISDMPNTVVRENYLAGVGGNGLYVDQGSSFVRFERNVVDMPAYWLHGNNGRHLDAPAPGSITVNGRILSPRTTQNVATGNWHNSLKVRGDWIEALDNRMSDNTLVPDKDWPAEALAVIANAGVRPEGR